MLSKPSSIVIVRHCTAVLLTTTREWQHHDAAFALPGLSGDYFSIAYRMHASSQSDGSGFQKALLGVASGTVAAGLGAG